MSPASILEWNDVRGFRTALKGCATAPLKGSATAATKGCATAALKGATARWRFRTALKGRATAEHSLRAGAWPGLALLLTLLLPVPARAQWLLTELGTLPGASESSSSAWDLNDDGYVVGQITLGDGTGRIRAVLWVPPGNMPIDLGTLPGGEHGNSEAMAVNASGNVVGRSAVANGAHAVLWTSAGGMIDLGVLGSSVFSVPNAIAAGISDTGIVVGNSSTSSGRQRAFKWTAAEGMTALGTPDGASSSASDVNDSGIVVGSSRTASGVLHAVMWTAAGEMVDLGTLGGPFSSASGINNAGVVVGWSHDPWNQFRAFQWTAGGGMIDLGVLGKGLGSGFSEAHSINDGGQIVGRSTPEEWTGLYQGFSWTEDGGMVDLGYPADLAPANIFARAVNNAGQVAGTLQRDGFPQRAVVWSIPGDAALSVSPESVARGSVVNASWSGIGAATPTDWLGLYAPGTDDTAYIAWMYVSCSKTPDAARGFGSCPFVVPPAIAAGEYEMRLFSNGGNGVFTPLATSSPFTVTASGGVPAVTVSPGTASPGGAATVSWSGISAPVATDWIGLYAAGSGETSYVLWMYVSCTKTPGVGRASGSCPIVVPANVSPGTYEIRLFASGGNGVYTQLATSNALAIE